MSLLQRPLRAEASNDSSRPRAAVRGVTATAPRAYVCDDLAPRITGDFAHALSHWRAEDLRCRQIILAWWLFCIPGLPFSTVQTDLWRQNTMISVSFRSRNGGDCRSPLSNTDADAEWRANVSLSSLSFASRSWSATRLCLIIEIGAESHRLHYARTGEVFRGALQIGSNATRNEKGTCRASVGQHIGVSHYS